MNNVYNVIDTINQVIHFNDNGYKVTKVFMNSNLNNELYDIENEVIADCVDNRKNLAGYTHTFDTVQLWIDNSLDDYEIKFSFERKK